MASKIKPGMLVRYTPAWCNPGEENFLLLVREERTSSGRATRWDVQNLSVAYLGGVHRMETVEEFMIEPIRLINGSTTIANVTICTT